MQIVVKNLSHTFGMGTINEFRALKNVSLTINQGEFIAIIGHTGSGKTTLIEHLNGLLKPTKGEIQIDGLLITSNRKQKIKNIQNIRKKVGIVFQFAEYQLFEETIEKDIIFGPINMGVSKERAKILAKEYLNLVGLSDEFLQRSPFSLSGGQKRRVALAGILAMEPEVLIFDEPTAGLDPEGARQMYEIFTKLNKKGKTIVVVTHDLDQVLQYTKRTIMLTNGKIVKDDATIDVLYDVNFLLDNELHPPKLVSLVDDLKRCGHHNLGKLHTIEELVKIKENNGQLFSVSLKSRQKPKNKSEDK